MANTRRGRDQAGSRTSLEPSGHRAGSRLLSLPSGDSPGFVSVRGQSRCRAALRRERRGQRLGACTATTAPTSPALPGARGRPPPPRPGPGRQAADAVGVGAPAARGRRRHRVDRSCRRQPEVGDAGQRKRRAGGQGGSSGEEQEQGKQGSISKGGAVGETALSQSGIRRRIRRRATAAGCQGRISGHSLRIGSAQSLVARGASTAELIQAGRWKDPKTATRYAAKEIVAGGAVARFFEEPKE